MAITTKSGKIIIEPLMLIIINDMIEPKMIDLKKWLNLKRRVLLRVWDKSGLQILKKTVAIKEKKKELL